MLSHRPDLIQLQLLSSLLSLASADFDLILYQNLHLPMTKIAYLECPTGIAGDMCLAALIDAGVPVTYLIDRLNLLGIADEYELCNTTVKHHGQVATHIDVKLLATTDHSHENHHGHHHHHHHHSVVDKEQHYHSPQRNLPQITALIEQAHLPHRAATWSLEVFRQLAIAEGIVHGIDPNLVHFHEVGAVDAIVDIVGTCLGLDYLGIEQVYCSALPTGGGTVKAAHGIMPVPVPAVLQLWQSRQVPVYHNGIDRELVTPTGAALAVTLAQSFGVAPAMTIHKIGLGAGTLQLPLPNILRLWIGESQSTETETENNQESDTTLETISVLETQIDDMNPQVVGYLFDRLLEAGALDVFTQPVGMKKSRPGILITVICQPDQVANCEKIIFQETTTIGIRRSTQQRSILPRQLHTVNTPYGQVRVKVATSNLSNATDIWNIQPEFADCAAIAQQNQLPWQTIYDLAQQTAWSEIGVPNSNKFKH
jgi:pyridinium-3,5-bisthiocarboxylic acid mononucleotide nickel chelatase